MRASRWVDAAYFGPQGFCNDNTSYKGKGPRIDLAFVNASAAGLLQSYNVEEGVNKKDHGMIRLVFNAPVASQTWKMPRKGETHIPYSRPPSHYIPERIYPDQDLHIALRMGDIDKAYRLWCRRAERFLMNIPRVDGTYTSKSNRGYTSVRKLCRFPPERDAATVDVWSRKVARSLRRVEALQKMAQWSHRSEQTFHHLQQFFLHEHLHFVTTAHSFRGATLSVETLSEMEKTLRSEYRSWQTKVRSSRIRAWKDRLQSSIRASYKWIRGQHKTELAPMKLANGSTTVDVNKQLDAFLTEWSPILRKYKSEQPDAVQFMQHFGSHMRTSTMNLDMITGKQPVQAAQETKPSSASLDRWTPASLTALSYWFPAIYDDLAAIMNAVEMGAQWPKALLEGYTSLIPKDETLTDPRPTDYRPITVLSAIYRLWGRARFGALLEWQEHWVSDNAFGCRPKHNAEGLAMQIALDLEEPAYEDCDIAFGVSYDFKKAFDLLPTNLVLATLQHRGMHPRILNGLRSLYQGLQRVFRLHGAMGPWWKSYNGLIQGDSLSMIALNSIVTCILEVPQTPSVRTTRRARSYADDLSCVVAARTYNQAAEELRSFHTIVQSYVKAGCGELNVKKTFTFGNDKARGILGSDVAHLAQFRIVGGAFETRHDCSHLTILEQERWSRWQKTIRRIRHLPRSWKERAQMMMQTQSQALFAAGIHALGTDPMLGKVHSDIMRSLWKADTYSMSPFITLSVLAPVQLDPFFGAIYENLRSIMRSMRNVAFRTQFRQRIEREPKYDIDGLMDPL